MLNIRFPVQLVPGALATSAYNFSEQHIKAYDCVVLVCPVPNRRWWTVMGPRGNLFDVPESWFKWELLQKPV